MSRPILIKLTALCKKLSSVTVTEPTAPVPELPTWREGAVIVKATLTGSLSTRGIYRAYRRILPEDGNNHASPAVHSTTKSF